MTSCVISRGSGNHRTSELGDSRDQPFHCPPLSFPRHTGGKQGPGGASIYPGILLSELRCSFFYPRNL